VGLEQRRSDRVDADFECSIRLYLKNGKDKHQVRLVNCSEGGLCVEVPHVHDELAREDRMNFLFSVGEETCAFSATVKWIGAPGGATSAARRYGAKIAEGSASNPVLYTDYVQYLFLRRRYAAVG
jgi:hypothetical protein